MGSGSGGVAAAFGFRYQYLVTVELLLDLYDLGEAHDTWRVGVDVHDQDSADLLVFEGPSDVPTRALQVKASLPSSSTKLDARTAERCLDALAAEHPGAADLVLVTNRELTEPAVLYRSLLLGERPRDGSRRTIDARSEDVATVAERLVTRIERIRARGRGGLGRRMHSFLLARLLDIVFTRGSRATAQYIRRSDVADVLDESAAVLADAAGDRAWGRTHGVPHGFYVPRAGANAFLDAHFDEESSFRGSPRVVVIKGLSGAGKSAAASAWASAHREHYACTIWIDASSAEVLEEQIPTVLDWLGAAEPSADDRAGAFRDALSVLPFPWLLIVDGATSPDTVQDWVPPSGYGHVITTTSRQDWPIDLAPQFGLDAIDDEDALQLVRSRLDGGEPGSHDDAVLDFASRLGRWPLAIDVACAWVRNRGGDLSVLRRFTERLDDLDLLSADGQQGAPALQVRQVIDRLVESISPESRLTLGMIVASGGKHVPVHVVERWSHSVRAHIRFDVTAAAVLEELAGTALITRRMVGDALDHRAAAEAVTVHDGIQMVLRDRVAAHAGPLSLWLEAYATAFNDEIMAARFNEASAMTTAAEALLRSVLGVAPAEPDGIDIARGLVAMSTTLMHNVGTLAMMQGRLATAAEWLRLAIESRELVIDEDQRQTAVFLATQIQTISTLIQVVVRQEVLDEVEQLARRTLRLLDAYEIQPSATEAIPVAEAVRVVASAARHAPHDLTEVIARLESRIDGLPSSAVDDTGLTRMLDEHRSVVQRSERLAATEQWSAAADMVLIAADRSAETGVLRHDAVETLIDVALQLMVSSLQRSHAPRPTPLGTALRRLADWGDTNGDELEPWQRLRLQLLRAVADEDPEAVSGAVNRVRNDGPGTEQAAAWVALGESTRERLIATRQFDVLFGRGIPAGMQILRTLDGGDHVRWALRILRGEAALCFATVSAILHTSNGASDPVRDALLAAGFPSGTTPDSRPHEAGGWSIRVDSDRIELVDKAGRQHFACSFGGELDRDPALRAWRSLVRRTGRVHVIYRDDAELGDDELAASDVQAMVGARRIPFLRSWRQRLRSRAPRLD